MSLQQTYAVVCNVCGEVIAVVRSDAGPPSGGVHTVGKGKQAQEHADAAVFALPEPPPAGVVGQQRLAWAAGLVGQGKGREL